MKDDDRFAGLGAQALTADREGVVRLSLAVMAAEVADGPVMTGDATAASYQRLKAGRHEREVFGCLFLTTRNRLIRDEELFYGSVDRTTVYPRVILHRPWPSTRARSSRTTQLGGGAVAERPESDRPREGCPGRD